LVGINPTHIYGQDGAVNEDGMSVEYLSTLNIIQQQMAVKEKMRGDDGKGLGHLVEL